MQYSTYLVCQGDTTIEAWSGTVLSKRSLQDLWNRQYVWVGFNSPRKPVFPERYKPGSYLIADGECKGKTLRVGDYRHWRGHSIRFSDLPKDVQDYVHRVINLQDEAYGITRAEVNPGGEYCTPKVKEQIALLNLIGPSEEYYEKGKRWNKFERTSDRN